jgi:beta-glucosidase
MRNLSGVSREVALAGFLLASLWGCSHPGAGGGGGSNGNPGAGGMIGGGMGGSNVTGTGGSIVIILHPDGGADAPASGGTGGTGGATVTGTGGMAKMACGDSSLPADPRRPGYVQDPAVLSQVSALMSGMTAVQKATQMRGITPATQPNFNDIFRTLDDTGKGIKGYQFRDGPRGVNLEAAAPNGSSGGKSTAFPVAMARAASWDTDLEFRIGQSMGDEMVAAGQTMLLSPTTNILRHPLWGRAQETFGEDPFQLGMFGSANVAGIQQYVAACAKHYAGNNIENNRAALNAQMDERTLREMYARHFEMMIKDGGVACIMAAYNSVNGVKSTQNGHLLNDVLRTDFGFKGFILTDWWAMPGGQAPANGTQMQTATNALDAGLDMELPWNLNFSVLETLAASSQTEANNMTSSVSRILEQKIRFRSNSINGPWGLKAATTGYSGGSITNNDAHIQIALEAAQKGMVLLKNQNNTLPIKRGSVTKIAVIGANMPYSVTSDATASVAASHIDFTTNAITLPSGTSNLLTGDRGSSRVLVDTTKAMGPLAGIQAAAGSISVVSGSTAAAAAGANFIVVVAGLTPQDEGEEYTGAGDRSSFSLDAKANQGTQNGLITSVATAAAASGTPMVVVLEGGSVIDMPWFSSVPAVVMAWYPGIVGGKALGQLLFGDVNFSGKLPITWGTLANYPTFNEGTTTVMNYDLGYRRFDRMGIALNPAGSPPTFPYGYGLSYTNFDYSNLQIPCGTVSKGAVVNVTFQLGNLGAVAGDEVAMLFVSYPNSTLGRPIKELKGFIREKNIAPGTAHLVTIQLRISDLKYWDTASSSWQIESGPVKIMVGPSSANLPLSDTVTVQ